MTAYKTSQNGPFSVILSKGEWIDVARHNRAVPYKIYYPADITDKMPVILWSHGFGGNRDGAAFISRYLASHGYIIAHITHQGTDSSLWEGKAGHPWDILRNTPIPRQTMLDRFADVPFALDQLMVLDSPIRNIMDFAHVGISGHSLGAITSQVMAGQLFPDTQGVLTNYHDSRFKAGVLYSPTPIAHLIGQDQASDATVYGPIRLPLLYMTGTEDDSPIEEFGYQNRLVIHTHSGHPKKYLHILEQGDHMIYNGTRGMLGVNPNRERHEDSIKITALAFWDAFLKDDKNAKAWLENGAAAAYMDDHGQFHAPQRD